MEMDKAARSHCKNHPLEERLSETQTKGRFRIHSNRQRIKELIRKETLCRQSRWCLVRTRSWRQAQSSSKGAPTMWCDHHITKELHMMSLPWSHQVLIQTPWITSSRCKWIESRHSKTKSYSSIIRASIQIRTHLKFKIKCRLKTHSKMIKHQIK